MCDAHAELHVVRRMIGTSYAGGSARVISCTMHVWTSTRIGNCQLSAIIRYAVQNLPVPASRRRRASFLAVCGRFTRTRSLDGSR